MRKTALTAGFLAVLAMLIFAGCQGQATVALKQQLDELNAKVDELKKVVDEDLKVKVDGLQKTIDDLKANNPKLFEVPAQKEAKQEQVQPAGKEQPKPAPKTAEPPAGKVKKKI